MLTQEEAKRWFNYNPISGRLTWAKSRQRIKKGDEAGNVNSHGYRVVGIRGKVHKAHKIIVVYMTGVWPDPKDTVDHVNGNRLDNRWINLRVISFADNCRNRVRANKNSTTGHLGICVHGARYSVYVQGKYVGKVDTIEEGLKMQKEHKHMMTPPTPIPLKPI